MEAAGVNAQPARINVEPADASNSGICLMEREYLSEKADRPERTARVVDVDARARCMKMNVCPALLSLGTSLVDLIGARLSGSS